MPRPSKSSGAQRSHCPISSTLELIGDRWTLVLVRDLFRGFSRYGEFLSQPEGIPTNILADRLVRLEEADIVTRKPYQDNPLRYSYELTTKGRSLAPVIGALGMWGLRNLPGTVADKALFSVLSA
jgi:DNA-binding HxlR family transcriptional regulator